MKEYAKLVKIKTNNVSDKGFKATLQLPSSKTLSGEWDFINFYVGIGTYECGISCRDKSDWRENGVLKWRSFANGEGQKPTYGSDKFSDGSIVTISIERNDKNIVEFKVNGDTVKKFNNPLINYENSARLILAACQATGTTPPLAPWKIKHNQVRAYDMKYKNSSGNWVAFRNGSNVTTEEWPIGVATPDNIKYILDKSYIGNAEVYASLNK